MIPDTKLILVGVSDDHHHLICKLVEIANSTSGCTCIGNDTASDDTFTSASRMPMPTMYFTLENHGHNYQDLMDRIDPNKWALVDWADWKSSFWSFVEELHPWVWPRPKLIKSQKYQQHRFNCAAFKRKINFSKSGHVGRIGRRRYKSKG